MKNDLVSVCIPTYNGSKYLSACLESALAQTYGNLEIVVVDDCSNDATVEIAREYSRQDSRVKVHECHRNFGLVGNWNRCLDLASGAWIKFLFQDDLIKPECVEALLKLATSRGCQIAACDREIIIEPGAHPGAEAFYLTHRETVKNKIMVAGGATPLQMAAGLLSLERLAFNILGEPTATIFSRESTRQLGRFDAALLLLCDAEYWVRMGQWSDIAFCADPLASFRVHRDATSQTLLLTKREACFLVDPLVLEHRYLFSPDFERLRAHFDAINKKNLRTLRHNHYELVARLLQTARDREAQGDRNLADELRLAERRVGSGLFEVPAAFAANGVVSPPKDFVPRQVKPLVTLGAPPPVSDMAPEIELLINGVMPPSRVETGRVASLLKQDLDWTVVVQTALSHGVSPLLARGLEAATPHLLPPEIRTALGCHLQDNRQRNVLLLQTLIKILDVLDTVGIRALPFKGQTLGAAAYGDFGLRRAGDVDLLIRQRDLHSACEVLESLGFAETTLREIGRPMSRTERQGYLRYQCEYAYFRPEDGVLVEPHWALAPTTLSIDIDLEELWQHADTVDLLGRRIPTLEAADLLLVLCIHASKHEWTRLQWICDVGWLLERHPDVPLPAVLSAARGRGLERMVLVGVGLAHAVLGTPIGRLVQGRIAEDATALRLIGQLRRRLFEKGVDTSPMYEVSKLRLEIRERARDRLAYIVRTITTPIEKHYRLLDLPESLSWLYVPIKLSHDYLALPLWRLSGRGRKDR